MPAKSFDYLRDRAAFALGTRCVVNVTGEWSVRCHPLARRHFEVFRTDPLQSKELTSFFEYACPGMRLLDIGAHYGFFALAALHAGGPATRVLCAEPSPKAVRVLRANLEANGATRNVEVVQAAMGDTDGILPMLTTGPFGGDYMVVPTQSRPDTVSVKVRSLRSLLKATGFEPTHIKIDIESYEFELLQAAQDVLSTLKPVLYLELHGQALQARGKDPAVILDWLRRAGYTSFICETLAAKERIMARSNFNCRLVCVPESR
jgi:FkbM family methyltransferase